MNELECSSNECGNVVPCDEGVIGVTCGYCCATLGITVCEED